jgi:Sulfotransferase family
MGRGQSPLQGRLVFATGCRRSGTNWLQRILTAHPDVAGMPSETYLFSGALSKVAERFQHANPGSPKTGKVFMSRDGMLDAMRDFADRVFEENLERIAPGARYLVERTPWHVYDLELIGEVYPDARAIHIVRDGRDVARSLLSQDWGPTRMEDAAEEWRSSVTAGRSAGKALGPRYLELRYEELLAAPESGIRGMYEWLGLETDGGPLERALAEAASEFNVDPKAPGVAAGKWREGLSGADVAAFDAIAGDLLEELGYERGGSPAAWPSLGTLRRRAGSVRRLAAPGALRRGGHARHLGEQPESDYVVFERFLERVAAGQLDAALDMLGPQALVRIVDGARTREGRGTEGARLLRRHLAGHAQLGPRVLSGNVHPGHHTSTSVATYRLLDGRTLARTLAVSVSGGKVTSLSLFEFELAEGPLAPAGPLAASR